MPCFCTASRSACSSVASQSLGKPSEAPLPPGLGFALDRVAPTARGPARSRVWARSATSRERTDAEDRSPRASCLACRARADALSAPRRDAAARERARRPEKNRAACRTATARVTDRRRGARRRRRFPRPIRSISATEKPVSRGFERMLRCRAHVALRKSLFFFVRRWTRRTTTASRASADLAPPAPRASPRCAAPARRDGAPRRAVSRRGIARRHGAHAGAQADAVTRLRVSAGRDRPDARWRFPGPSSTTSRSAREGGAVGQGARGLAAMRNAGRALLDENAESRRRGTHFVGQSRLVARPRPRADERSVGTIVDTRHAHTRRRVDGRFLRRG